MSSAGARPTRCRRHPDAGGPRAAARRPRSGRGRRELDARLGRLGGDGFATGAISMALDDLRARRRGVPVHALYGGARRRTAPAPTPRARATSPVGAVVEAWLDEADRAVEAGFTGFKLRIGREPIADELAAAAAVRRAHPDAGAHGRRQRRLHPAPGDRGRRGTRTTSSSAGSRSRCRRPTTRATSGCARPCRWRWPAASPSRAAAQAPRPRSTAAAFDIIQPDVSICGGIGEALAIGGLARLAAIDTHPHACNGALGLAATLQVLAAPAGPESASRRTRRSSSTTSGRTRRGRTSSRRRS